MFKVARSIQFKVIGTCKMLGDDLTDINHDVQKRNPKTKLRYGTGVCVSHQSIQNCGEALVNDFLGVQDIFYQTPPTFLSY